MKSFSEVGFNDVKSDEASATLYLEEMFEATKSGAVRYDGTLL